VDPFSQIESRHVLKGKAMETDVVSISTLDGYYAQADLEAVSLWE